MKDRRIEVCLSPELLHLYEVKTKIIVVADILRATSCMVTAFAHGVQSIQPFSDLETCLRAAALGYETSGERNGVKVEGFDGEIRLSSTLELIYVESGSPLRQQTVLRQSINHVNLPTF